MDLHIKLENVFKNLVENEGRFGPNNKFISLSVQNLDGSKASSDGSGKVYLGVLKFYSVPRNDFKSVDLFIKIEPKTQAEREKYNGEVENGQDLIRYDFKFHNEYVAYKNVLPFLDRAFSEQRETVKSPFTGIGLKRFSYNDEKENAYTIEEFKNEARYKEIGNKKQYRHSWNPSIYERSNSEENFVTIKPNSTYALDKCVKYFDTTKDERVIKRQTNKEILNIFPEFYHGEINDTEDNIIVIQNMLPAGFHTDNDSIFLDKDRILLTLKTLGKFHAASYIAKHNHRKEFDTVVRQLKATGWTLPEYWDIYPEFLDQHLLRGFERLKKDFKYARHVYKFDAMLRNPKEKFFSLITPDEKTGVICHGDFCKNNILYQYKIDGVTGVGSANGVRKVEATSKKTNDSEKAKKEIKENQNIDVDFWEERDIPKLVGMRTISSDINNETVENQKNVRSLRQNLDNERANRKDLSTVHNKVKTMSGIENDRNFYDEIDNDPWEERGAPKLVRIKTISSDINDETREYRKSVNLLKENVESERTNRKDLGSYHNKTNTMSKIENYHNVYERNTYTWPYNRQRKENNSNQYSQTVDRRRKEFLHEILDTKESRPYLIQKKKIGSETKVKEKNIETPIVKTKNTNIDELKCIENEGLRIPSMHSYRKENNIKPASLSSMETQRQTRSIGFEKENENDELGKIHENTNSIIKETESIITDRLEFLEEKYRQLEKIYNVNKCVLERRVVNLQIIEKLNEKKKILEEICKKIEKICQRQQMEIKLQNSMEKLYQNVDDVQLNQKNLSLNHKSKACDDKKNINNVTDAFTGKEKSKRNSSRSSKVQFTIRSLKDEEKLQNSIHVEKSIEERFNELYGETFSNDADTDYDKIYSELTKSMDDVFQDNLNEPSNIPEAQETNTLHDQKKERSSTQDEYQTLTVKQRRDNLERSISLSNELKSFDKRQFSVKGRKGIRRSNSDANQLEPNKVLVSWRNITLNNVSEDDSESKTMMKDILRGLQAKKRPRIFTDSSLSINEYEETVNDDVFLASEHKKVEVRDSNIESKELHNHPIEEPKRILVKSQTIPNKVFRPVPLKRTIGLLDEQSQFQNQTNQMKGAAENHDESTYNSDTLSSEKNLEKKRKFFINDTYYQRHTLPFTTHERRANQVQSMDHRVNNLILKDTVQNKKMVEQACQTEPAKENPPKEYDTTKTGMFGNKREPLQYEQSGIGHSQTLKSRSKSTQDGAGSSRTLKTYSENQPKIVFFDLARMIYASPVIDLSFFLFLNVSHELRVSCWDEFITTYHSSLRSCIPANVPVPSFADLLKELKDKCVYGYFLCCFFLPWMMEENPHQQVDQWIHNGGEEGTEAIANILRFLIDRRFV